MNVSPDEKIDEEPEFEEASAGVKSNEEEEVSADFGKDVNMIFKSLRSFLHMALISLFFQINIARRIIKISELQSNRYLNFI